MITVEVEITGIEDLAKAIDFAESVWPEIRQEGLEWLGGEFVTIESNHINSVVEFEGNLARSVGYQVSEDMVTIGPNVAGGGEDEGKIMGVLEGSRPRWVSLDALRPWAARKLGDERFAQYLQYRIAGLVPGKPGGTSVFQQSRHGGMDFPFPQETLDLPAAQDALQTAADMMAEKLVARFI